MTILRVRALSPFSPLSLSAPLSQKGTHQNACPREM